MLKNELRYDVAAMEPMAQNPKCRATCRDCGNDLQVRRSVFERRSLPRCPKCGGLLEPSSKACDDLAALRSRHNRVDVDDAQMAAWKRLVREAYLKRTVDAVIKGKADPEPLVNLAQEKAGKRSRRINRKKDEHECSPEDLGRIAKQLGLTKKEAIQLEEHLTEDGLI